MSQRNKNICVLFVSKANVFVDIISSYLYVDLMSEGKEDEEEEKKKKRELHFLLLCRCRLELVISFSFIHIHTHTLSLSLPLTVINVCRVFAANNLLKNVHSLIIVSYSFQNFLFHPTDF